MSRKKPPKKFYELSRDRRTSAEIIAEARHSVRSLSSTTRPYTPAQQGRHLFGADGVPATSRNRPPSTFSIGQRHFGEDTSRPPTGHHRLTPIDDNATSNVPPTPVQSSCDLDAVVQPHPKSSDVPAKPQLVPQSGDIQPRPPSSDPPPRRRKSGDVRIRSGDSHKRSGDVRTRSGDPHTRSGDVRTRSGDPHTRSGDVRIRSGDPHTRSGHKINKLENKDENSRTRSGDARVRSHDQEIVCNVKQQPQSPIAPTASLVEQQVTSSNYSREIQSHLTSQSDSHISQPNCNDAATIAAATPAKFSWEKQVTPVLNAINSASRLDTEVLCELCTNLWTTLQSSTIIGRATGKSKQRSSVLRAMFQLLDSKESRLLLRATKIILAMGVTGNNLLNVSKLIFSISRSEHNDKLFDEEEMIQPIVKLLGLIELSDALVYVLGAVKLLAGNVTLRAKLVTCGVINCLVVVLEKITEPSKSPENASSILVQLLAILRNLSDSSSSRDRLLATDSLLDHLCSVLLYHCCDPDVAFNLCRLLSKLTQHNDHRSIVMQHLDSALPAFVGLLADHMTNPDIVVRICFILGNMTSRDDNFRLMLHGFKISSTLEKLLDHYQSCDAVDDKQTESQSMSNGTMTKSKMEDVLIKLVRLIANLTVNLQVGGHVATRKRCVKYLIKILEHRSYQENTELVQNVIVTINNLSFYQVTDNYVTKSAVQISQLLVPILLEDNGAGLLECVRVYGNLSQDAEVRKLIIEKKIDQLLLLLLDSESRDLVYSSCGVLVNLTADHMHRSVLSDNATVGRLADVLRDFGRNDWQLASLVCKILWNYSGSMTTSSNQSLFKDQEAQILVELLETYLDDTQVMEFPDDVSTETRSIMEEMWREQFVPVAEELLYKITSSDLIPL